MSKLVKLNCIVLVNYDHYGYGYGYGNILSPPSQHGLSSLETEGIIDIFYYVH